MRAISTVMLLAMIVLGGCGEKPQAAGGKPVIIASIYPLADIAQQLVGDGAEVICLLPPGQSPHGYEMTASQVAAMHRADFAVTCGLGVDEWAVGAAASVEGLHYIVFARAMGIADDAHEDDADVHAHDEHVDHHHHGAVNPHVWLDPVLVRQFAAKLATGLGAKLPDLKPIIDANEQQLLTQLDALDLDYGSQLKPFAGRQIITFHDAFDRLAERYGLTIGGTLTTAQAPAAGVTVASLEHTINAIREHHVKVIFAEPQFSTDAARMLETETGVKVRILDPLGDPRSTDRNGYIAMMRYNLRQLTQGLSAADE